MPAIVSVDLTAEHPSPARTLCLHGRNVEGDHLILIPGTYPRAPEGGAEFGDEFLSP